MEFKRYQLVHPRTLATVSGGTIVEIGINDQGLLAIDAIAHISAEQNEDYT
jgi:hypothetical protein